MHGHHCGLRLGACLAFALSSIFASSAVAIGVAPVITSISPNPVPAVDGSQWIYINGTGFVQGLTTTLRTGSETYFITNTSAGWVSSAQIKIYPNLTSQSAPWTVQIVNPDGQQSNVFSFNVGTSVVNVSISASPTSGTAPLNGVSLTATVSGSAQGTINYTFYCNRSDSGTNIYVGWDWKFDGVSDNPKTATCSYQTSGTYTAKVIAERGSALPAEARVTIFVSQPIPVQQPPPVTTTVATATPTTVPAAITTTTAQPKNTATITTPPTTIPPKSSAVTATTIPNTAKQPSAVAPTTTVASVFQGGLALPFESNQKFIVTQGFNTGNHTGKEFYALDFSQEGCKADGRPTAYGKSVKAVQGGKIKIDLIDDGDYGINVVIAHPNGTKSMYAHLSAVEKGLKDNDWVDRGRKVGEIGSSGLAVSTSNHPCKKNPGTHLHFYMYTDDTQSLADCPKKQKSVKQRQCAYKPEFLSG